MSTTAFNAAEAAVQALFDSIVNAPLPLAIDPPAAASEDDVLDLTLAAVGLDDYDVGAPPDLTLDT